jgi:hypothetical protein
MTTTVKHQKDAERLAAAAAASFFLLVFHHNNAASFDSPPIKCSFLSSYILFI